MSAVGATTTAVRPPYSQAFCEREYNLRARVPEHEQIFARWREAARAARAAHAATLDIVVGPTPHERIDFFPAQGVVRPAPLLIFVHGGYWRSLDKRDFSWLAAPFTARGIHVALTNYGLAPDVPIEEQVRQTLRAHAWLYRTAESLNIDREAIFTGGHSAGAHLASMMLLANWDVYAADLPRRWLRGGVLVSGVYDLEPLLWAPFVNVDLRLDAERVATLSSAYLPMPDGTRIVASVGERETSEFVRQTRLLLDAWPHAALSFAPAPDRDHYTVCDALAEPGHPLFEAAWALIASR